MKILTKRQIEVLDFIRNFMIKNNYPPSLKDISKEFNISAPGARDHLKALEKKGKIEYSDNLSRAIRIVGQESNYSDIINIPIIGKVAAGRPLLAEENYDGSINISASRLGTGEFFALRVSGYSMKDVGIIDNDIAIIKQQNTAKNGEIVVAMINDDSYTIKRFYRESNRIKLKAENPDFPPTYSRNVKIIGKLRCIVRDYD